MLEKLQGAKTYIVLVLALALVGANLLGIIDKATAEPIMIILALLGGVTMSAKVNRLSQILGGTRKDN